MGTHHDHDHHHGEVPAAADLSIPDRDLSPGELSRRSLLRGAGALGLGAAAIAATPGIAHAGNRTDDGHHGGGDGLVWLAGDHHIHTQYSSDAQYRVIDHVRHATAYGLDWMVITDHGSVPARQDRRGEGQPGHRRRPRRGQGHAGLPGPGVEHPGRRARHRLRPPGQERGRRPQGVREHLRRRASRAPAPRRPANEALAIAGVNFLADAVPSGAGRGRAVPGQPPGPQGHRLAARDPRLARRGSPGIAVGMEGAPGHQAAGIPAPNGPGSARGFYDNSADAPTRSPATRWRATAPGAASTG